MEKETLEDEQARAIHATKKRHALAILIDYLLFAMVWHLLERLIGEERFSFFWLAGLGAFCCAEALLTAWKRATPGRQLLGISATSTGWTIDRLIKSSESWLTILAGLIFVWSGSGAISKCQATPPILLFGFQTSPPVSLATWLVLGTGELVAGLGLLRLKRWALVLGFGVLGIEILSILLNWSQSPTHILELIAAAKERGELASIPDARIKSLVSVLRWLPLVLNTIHILLLGAASMQFRRSPLAAPPPPGNERSGPGH